MNKYPKLIGRLLTEHITYVVTDTPDMPDGVKMITTEERADGTCWAYITFFENWNQPVFINMRFVTSYYEFDR